MRPKLLLATNNPGKLREYRLLLLGLPFQLTTPAGEGLEEVMVKEGEGSFAENASLKAVAYAFKSGLLTLADDSGLEVETLGGAPGVLSSRYAGEGASDEERISLLLSRLAGVSWEKRQARFRCVIAIASPSGKVETVEGEVGGVVALEPRGRNGFGYDPVFYLPSLGKTMAQLSVDEKNRVSHRSQAARKAGKILLEKVKGK